MSYTRDGARRLKDATDRSYGGLKASLQRLGTPTSQHNVKVTKSAAKKAAKKPAKKAAAKKTAAKKTAAKKTAAKKTAAKKS